MNVCKVASRIRLQKNAIICKQNMRFDVVCIYTYITITQYVSKDKNQKSEFFVSFF